jgi:glycerol-3-phosphate acyltransferase PlsX
VGFIALPVLRALRLRIDPREYNGASFVGLRGIVIKSHGGADVLAFTRAIDEAIAEIRKNVPERISQHLESVLSQAEAV